MMYFLKWLFTPSGGTYETAHGRDGLVVKIINTPVFAHPVGGFVVAAIALLFHLGAASAGFAVLVAEGVNQFYKASRGVYGESMWFNVFARLFLAGVGAALAVTLLT